jgi:hypothetical protein
MSAAPAIISAALSSRVRTTRAGEPTISERSGNSLPSVTSAPAQAQSVFSVEWNYQRASRFKAGMYGGLPDVLK